jgi:adenine phosphoribosyltransferase
VADDPTWLRELVRDIPDYPQPGIVFRDITPLLAQADAFNAAIHAIGAPFASERIDKVVGVEARGFILAAPVAAAHGAGFVPVRKAGRLPWQIEREEYELEYGTDLLEIHHDAVAPDERVLVVDDVLATGGTAAATVRLVERLGGEVAGATFLIELAALAGRNRLDGIRVHAVMRYE